MDDLRRFAINCTTIQFLWIQAQARDACGTVHTQELKATTVVGMTIEEASAKIRTGPPRDDEGDYDLPVWAGVIPLRQVFGDPVPDPHLCEDTKLPLHVTTLVPGADFSAIMTLLAKSR